MDLREVVGRILDAVPRRYRRAGVRASIGPSASQVKRLARLPRVNDETLLEAVVREGAGRFFVTNGSPLLVTGIVGGGEGVVWAGALDAAVVGEVAAACRSRRRSLELVAPAAVALRWGLQGEGFVWRDGDCWVEVHGPPGALTSVRRGKGDRSPIHEDVRPPEALTHAGTDAHRFAAAYGVVAIPGTERLVARAGAQIPFTTPRRAGTVLAATGLAVAGAVYLFAPVLVSEWRADRVIEAITPSIADRDTAQRSEGELVNLTMALMELDAVRVAMPSALQPLGSLSSALPSGGRLSAIEVNGATGRIVALVPSAVDLVRALERLPEVRSLTIDGPVGAETADGQIRERVTLRLDLLRHAVEVQ